jgi:hypothetical protein
MPHQPGGKSTTSGNGACGGPTCVGNAGLLCSRHHQNLDFNGWVAVMVNGRPYYVPPAWINPNQGAQGNTVYDEPSSVRAYDVTPETGDRQADVLTRVAGPDADRRQDVASAGVVTGTS